jgi:hypothetical protein
VLCMSFASSSAVLVLKRSRASAVVISSIVTMLLFGMSSWTGIL